MTDNPRSPWQQLTYTCDDWRAAENTAVAVLGPLLTAAQDKGDITSWWFIRKGPEWRVRLESPADSLTCRLAEALREHLPDIRSKLDFTEVASARQGLQYERYRRVFRNENNSTDLVISRRWTAVQAPNGIVTTIRFRDCAVRLPYQLAGAYPVQAKDVTVTGQVADADLGNLFPRVFRLLTGSYAYFIAEVSGRLPAAAGHAGCQ